MKEKAPEVVVLPDPEAVAHEAARRLVTVARRGVKRRGRFTLALAGGSTPARLYHLLAGPDYRDAIPWSHVWVCFGDERCVPPHHPDSNYHLAHEALLSRVPIPPDHVVRIAGELEPEAAAAAYEEALRRCFDLAGAGRPRFDLILLGMGEDGHTASLFPGLPALEEKGRLAVATAVPEYARPAVPRVTLTLPVLNAARQVIFLVTGAHKACAVGAVLAGLSPSGPLPAALVRPRQGRLVWLLDREARASLHPRDPGTSFAY